MPFSLSFVIITWIAIALLTLGLVGCIRYVKLLDANIDERLQSPARLKPGDTVYLPQELSDRVSPAKLTVLLFVQAGCSTCLAALERIQQVAGDLDHMTLLALWKGDAHPKFEGVGVPNSTDAFQALHVAVTPFLVFLHNNEVVMSAALGSKQALAQVEGIIASYNPATAKMNSP